MPTAFTLKLSSSDCDALVEDLSPKSSRETSSKTTDGNSGEDMLQPMLAVRRETLGQEVEAVREKSEEAALVGLARRASDTGYKTSTAKNNGSISTISHRPREGAPSSDSHRHRPPEHPPNLFFPQHANLPLLEKSLLAPGPSQKNTTATTPASATANANASAATNHSINHHMTHELPHRLSDDNSSLVTASSILNHMKQLATVDESMINTPSLPSTGPKKYPHHEHLNLEHNTKRTAISTATPTSSIYEEKERSHAILNGHEASMRERMAAYHRLQSRMAHVTNETQENVDLSEHEYFNHRNGTTNSSHIHNDNDSLAHHTNFHPFSDYALPPTMRAQTNHNSVAAPRNLDFSYLNRYLQPNFNYQSLMSHQLQLPNNNTAAPLLQRYSNLQQDYSLLTNAGISGPLAMGNNDPSRARRFMNTPLGLGYATTEQNHMSSIHRNHIGFIIQPPDSFPNYHQGLDYIYPTSELPDSLSNTIQRTRHPLQSQNSHLSLVQQQQQPLLQCTNDINKQEQDTRGSLSLLTMDQTMSTIDQDNASDGADCFEACFEGIRRSGQLSGLYRHYVPKTGKEETSIKSTENSSLATSSLISYPVRMPDSVGHQVSPKSWTNKSLTTSTSSRTSTRTHLVSLKELNTPPCYKDPMNLGAEEDSQHLSKFLQFLRSECCEVFTASEDEVFQRRKSKQIRLHQVGIRCALCAGKAYNERTLRSACYPSSFDRIYQSVTMMIRDHFPDCPHFSESMRMKYDTIKASSVRKGNYEAKSYWIKSAQLLGIVETDEGLFFLK